MAGNAADRTLDELVEQVTVGTGPQRTRAAARLMTVLEAEPQRLAELHRRLPADARLRPPVVLGITGAPGTGKSTLVDGLVATLRQRDPERRVGVIAVDPSSPFTGGAVLGDRVRMMRHATDPHVFIRSLATRGHLGGLSLGVKGVLRVMALLGCDVVVIETVGVGQSEVEIAGLADNVAVVLAPGAGDSVQMLKAGLMEVGDVFIVNKADTDGADALHRALVQTLSLAAHGNGSGSRASRPDVLLTSASEGRGLAELADWIGQRAASNPARADDVRDDVRDAVLEAVRARVLRRLETEPALLDDLLQGTGSVGSLAAFLLATENNDEIDG